VSLILRLQPWPIVDAFLKSLPDGSIGLDVGCGNGKYLPVNSNVFILGSDMSLSLAKIASRHSPHESFVADNLNLPHPAGMFDFAISIAVIHHLSTLERRIAAVKALLETLKPSALDEHDTSSSGSCRGGKVLIYVWALEQKDSRRGWDKDHAQDVMVPWVMKTRSKDKSSSAADNGQDVSQTFQRYYHLYRSGELENNIVDAGGVVLESGYEKDNWWAIAARKASSITET
jgi:tRNA (uracil-5-)-methyltransferase TRM9